MANHVTGWTLKKKILVSCLSAAAVALIVLAAVFGPGAVKRATYRETAVAVPAGSSPTIDKYGQLVSVNFAMKVKSDVDLKSDVKADEVYYGSLKPPARDSWGGLPGSRAQYNLKATGYFHVEKLPNGKNTFVTPQGNVFFGLGVNGVGYVGDTYTQVKGREGIYAWLPLFSKLSKFRTAYLNDASDDYSFYVSNKIIKTGKAYTEADFYDESASRLKDWGFNCEGGWCDSDLGMAIKFPTVRHLSLLGNIPEGNVDGIGIFDIFADNIRQKIDGYLAPTLKKYKDDPSLIGYFLDNEMEYYRMSTVVPGLQGSKFAVKKRLVQMLKDEYKGDIMAFDGAWGEAFGSFDEMVDSKLKLTTDEATADMYSFIKLYAETYYKTVADVVHKYDTNHLLIGDRWFVTNSKDSTLRDVLSEAAGKYMDVISFNYYTYDLNLDTLKSIYEKSGGKPILLSEFLYADPTEGLMNGVKVVSDEKEKGLAYRNYVEQAAACGYVVGTSWFEYLDEAATGRWFQGVDGENFACGLLNVADRPYKDMLSSVMQANYSIYDIFLGKTAPYHYDFGPGRSEKTNTQGLQIQKAKGAITIDGVLDNQWPGFDQPGVVLSKKNLALGVDTGDNSAEFHFAWDEKNLYIFVHVKDPTPMQNTFKADGIWNGDAIELFTGPDDTDKGGSYKANDRQIILRASQVDGKFEAHWWHSDTQPQINFVVKMDDDKKGYSIEAAIPLSGINITNPASGTKLRFDFGLDDGNGPGRVAQWLWNGADGDQVSRDKWGQAVLAD